MSELTQPQRDFEAAHISLRLDLLAQDVAKARQHALACHQAIDEAMKPLDAIRSDLDEAAAAYNAATQARMKLEPPLAKARDAELSALFAMQNQQFRLDDATRAVQAAKRKHWDARGALLDAEAAHAAACKELAWIRGKSPSP